MAHDPSGQVVESQADLAPPTDGPEPVGPRRPLRRAVLWAGAPAALVIALVAVVAVRSTPSGPKVEVSDPRVLAPAFDVADLRDPNDRMRLADLRGKPAVVNFWASWCVPCRREMPGLEAAHRELGERVAFVGMNHQDGRRAALALLEETGVRYRSGFDPEGRVARDYGLVGMPTTVFISADGRRLATRIGEMSREELEETIERLFWR